MKFNLILSLFLFLFTGVMQAQNTTLTGTVTDNDGTTLIGANVTIEALGLGVITDQDGKYLMTIPNDKADGKTAYTIVATYLGYTTTSKEIVLNSGNNNADFSMEAGGYLLEDVEVTALKGNATRKSETPIAISSYSGDWLERTGVRTVKDFLQGTPGLTVYSVDQGLMSIQIRGISSIYGNSAAGFYLDDLPFTIVNSPFVPEINPFDMESVEVLRGPQGTLYGANSESGVVRFLTKNADPTRLSFKADLETSVTDGGDPNYGAHGAINIPIVKNKLALRALGGYEKRGGWLSNNQQGLDNTNDMSLYHFRGKLNYRPSDQLSIRGSLWHQFNKAGSTTLSDENYDRSNFFTDETYDVDYTLANGTIEYKFPGLSLYSTTSYIKTNFMADDASGITAKGVSDVVQIAINEELRVSTRSEGPINFTGGIFYMNADLDTYSELNALLPDGSLLNIPFAEYNVVQKQFAVFGELYYKFLNNKMQATLGLRYANDKQEYLDILPSTVASLQALGLSEYREESFSKVAPRFNLAYYPAQNSVLYISAANGYRSGTIQDGSLLVGAVAFGHQGVEPFIDPENLWTYEIGGKYTTPDKKLLLETVFYYNDWSDLIVLTQELIDFMGALSVVAFGQNVGKARSYGVDFNVEYTGIKNLSLVLNTNVNSSTFEDDLPGVIGIKSGDRIYHVPDLTLSASATYSVPIGGAWTGTIYGNFEHHSEKLDYRAGEIFSGDAISFLRARIGVENDNYGIFLFGNNLLGESGIILPSTFAEIPQNQLPRPRVMGVNLQFKF